jgi:hypothetical protein
MIMSMTFDEEITRTVRKTQEIDRARADVRLIAGDAVMGMDSIASIYCAGLRALGHDPRELRGSDAAAKSLFNAVRNRGVVRQPKMDPKMAADMAARFPGASKLKVRG